MSLFSLRVNAQEALPDSSAKVLNAATEENVPDMGACNMADSLEVYRAQVGELKSQKLDVLQGVGFGLLALLLAMVAMAVVFNKKMSKLKRDLCADKGKGDAAEAQKKEFKNLVIKITNLETRLAAVERNLKLVAANGQSAAQSSVGNATAKAFHGAATSAKKDHDIFYMSAPVGFGEFDNAARSDKQRQDSIYEFHRLADGTAEFELKPADGMGYWILENRQQVIETVCDVEKYGGGTHAVTLTKGLAELSNGKWIVKRRAKVMLV